MTHIQHVVFGQVHKYGIFRTCVVYVDFWETISDPKSQVISRQLEIISFDLRIYGAQVLNRMDSNVTHVLCDPVSCPHRSVVWKTINRQREFKFKLVRLEWVVHSINKGSLVEEIAYYP